MSVLEDLRSTNVIRQIESIFRKHAGDILHSFKQLQEAKQNQQMYFQVNSLRLENYKTFNQLVINPSDADKNRLQVTIRYLKKHNKRNNDYEAGGKVKKFK